MTSVIRGDCLLGTFIPRCRRRDRVRRTGPPATCRASPTPATTRRPTTPARRPPTDSRWPDIRCRRRRTDPTDFRFPCRTRRQFTTNRENLTVIVKRIWTAPPIFHLTVTMQFLADRTAVRSVIGYWHRTIVCPSVCLVCDAVYCGAQSRCRGLKVVLSCS